MTSDQSKIGLKYGEWEAAIKWLVKHYTQVWMGGQGWADALTSEFRGRFFDSGSDLGNRFRCNPKLAYEAAKEAKRRVESKAEPEILAKRTTKPPRRKR